MKNAGASECFCQRIKKKLRWPSGCWKLRFANEKVIKLLHFDFSNLLPQRMQLCDSAMLVFNYLDLYLDPFLLAYLLVIYLLDLQSKKNTEAVFWNWRFYSLTASILSEFSLKVFNCSYWALVFSQMGMGFLGVLLFCFLFSKPDRKYFTLFS